MRNWLGGFEPVKAGAAAALAGVARAASQRALNAVLPPRCVGCRALIDRQGDLCSICWGGLSFIEEPLCAVCGFPFELDAGPGALCGACARHLPSFKQARSVLRYDDASRDLVLAFKHGDRTEFAVTFGRWMARSGRALLTESDVIVPVPLHWRRLFSRRYNQSALLANALSGCVPAVRVLPDTMWRRRNDPSQFGRSATARRANVRGAFRVLDRVRSRISGKRILLVDDVYTTGATVEACTRVLRTAGAEQVSVLTLSRVVRPNSDSI